MKNYWLSDNREMAEQSTLHMLIGRLEGMKEYGKEPTCNELLSWIEETINKQEARLNERFPDKAHGGA